VETDSLVELQFLSFEENSLHVRVQYDTVNNVYYRGAHLRQLITNGYYTLDYDSITYLFTYLI